MKKEKSKKAQVKRAKEFVEVKSYIKERIREDKPIEKKKLKGFKIVAPL